MNIYNKLLIAFMWEKQNILESEGIFESYMNEETEKVIEKWDDDISEKVYKQLVFLINSSKSYSFGDEISGLGGKTCPFCIKLNLEDISCTNRFNFCEYGEISGYCNSIESIYDILTREYESTLDEIFTKKTYKEIIDYIEKESGVKNEVA